MYREEEKLMCNIGIHCSVFAKCLNGKKKSYKAIGVYFFLLCYQFESPW